MNKEETMISTLPIKPQANTNIGMMIAPTIMDFIGEVLDIEKNLSFNILHTYDSKIVELDNYLTYIKNSKIDYDSIFIDKDYGFQLLEIVSNMYKNGLIKEKYKEVLRCNCGVVDMVYSSDKNNAKLYTIKNNKRYCNCCKSECYKVYDKCLVFEIKELANEISIVPLYLKKEVDELAKQFLNSDILVSKKRNTGYSLEINNHKYNIDIDFLWSNYFKLYNKENQIYISSNHQIFNIYLMNYLAQNTSNKNLTFIASPYVKGDLKEIKRQYEMRVLKEYKVLLLLYNLKWKNKDSTWSDSVMQYLTNISDKRLENLYKSIIISAKNNENLDLDQLINSIFNQETNMQNSIKNMKKLYKEGRL